VPLPPDHKPHTVVAAEKQHVEGMANLHLWPVPAAPLRNVVAAT
jgi:hypothetical protein